MKARKVREIYVTTKKPCGCWGCTKDIPLKSKVLVVVGKWGDAFTRAYWCDDCHDKVALIEKDSFEYGEFIKCIKSLNKPVKQRK
jgi:hypothetical protein